MTTLLLHDFHQGLGAQFTAVNNGELVDTYGAFPAEYAALTQTAGVIDLSARGRICVTGADRVRFLNGQVTNNVKDLEPGEGCYAALVTAKGRIQSDCNIYCLGEELLLDFEPGLTPAIITRLERYVIADDVTLTDVAALYGLITVQGPSAGQVLLNLGLGFSLPVSDLSFAHVNDPVLGEIYCMHHSRTRAPGFDLFVPSAALAVIAPRLMEAARAVEGRAVGWQALEARRIEAAIPRFGMDMDETNLPPETGLEQRAVSLTKGCYIGQEVIARIRTYGQATKTLRGLTLPNDLEKLPAKGNKLFCGTKEVGYITSALASPQFGCNIGLGYVRREHNKIGTWLGLAPGDETVRLVPLPFHANEIAIEKGS